MPCLLYEVQKEVRSIPIMEIFKNLGQNSLSCPGLQQSFHSISCNKMVYHVNVSLTTWYEKLILPFTSFSYPNLRQITTTVIITRTLSALFLQWKLSQMTKYYHLRLASNIYIISHFKMRGMKWRSWLYCCFWRDQEPSQYFCWHHSRIFEKSTVLLCEL